MEYIFGSLVTMMTLFFASKMLQTKEAKRLRVNVTYNQTRAHQLLAPLKIFADIMFEKEQVPTQSTKHNDSMHIKVIIAGAKAYWIANHKFYVADVLDSGVVQESAKEVDTMVMDDVQLKQISEIVELLRKEEGTDDRSNPGFKGL